MAYHRFDGVVKNSICPMQIRAFTAVRQSRLTRSAYLSPAPIYGQIVEFPMDVFRSYCTCDGALQWQRTTLFTVAPKVSQSYSKKVV
jgi:hypothetical protein